MTTQHKDNADMTSNLNELAIFIRRTAQEHGWEDVPRSFGEEIALWHSEASEAFEEFRSNHTEQQIYGLDAYGNEINPGVGLGNPDTLPLNVKPEGIPVEAADLIIRVLHWAARANVDIQAVVLQKMQYNETRPYRHGNKAL